MKKLLIPYADNSLGELTHIENAIKGEKYTCHKCGLDVIVKKGKVRTPHFAHKGDSSNHCAETILHKVFKEKTELFIQECINKKVATLNMTWHCERCNEIHNGILQLQNINSTSLEYKKLDDCIPDIALLDVNENIIAVIEVVYAHKPEDKPLEFYKRNNILCIQIKIDKFEDCECIEEKISSPYNVNICSNPNCEKCNCIMHTSNYSNEDYTLKNIDYTINQHSSFNVIYSGEYQCLECLDFQQKLIQQQKDKERFDKLLELKRNEKNKFCPNCNCNMNLLVGADSIRYKCPNCSIVEYIEDIFD